MAPIMSHNHSYTASACPIPTAKLEQQEAIRFKLSMLEEDRDEEDYSADDEGGMDFESSFDTSFNHQSLGDMYSGFYGAVSTFPKDYNRDMSNRAASTDIRTHVLNYQTDIEEDEWDEEIIEDHECSPNCFLCRISTSICRIQHPELYYSSDEEDDFEDCTTSMPATHCVPDCISCARERLRAEGYKFPRYQYDQSDHTEDDDDAEMQEMSKPPKQGIKQEEADVKDSERRGSFNFSLIFTPPPSGLQKQAESTARSVELIEPFPRVFFPPPKTSDTDVC
ncbi:hypothetical protein GGU10DRAFT_340838 [Lentinula aff. detonsa]|uniref:Uncharacterized protein n=1 Tax=Lentinula aff. detonsa TaxID=2804958 RepID=A0AA38U048_9AGAR|nr:hypothetical protein GGU10DRAFT_340838 [Lentinula aff. detonsa]